MDRKIYGYINCPTCGHEKGMRITKDKSGAPFGFCEANCNQQLRIGGSGFRVRAFGLSHPEIALKMLENPVTENPQPEILESPPAPPAAVKPKKPAFSMDTL